MENGYRESERTVYIIINTEKKILYLRTTIIMKKSHTILLLRTFFYALLWIHNAVESYVTPTGRIHLRTNTNIDWKNPKLDMKLNMSDERRFEDVTSFGYEGIPEEQRPATEYNNMRQSLLFNWASEESGTKGLLVRLGVTYLVFFVLICYPIAGATFTSEGYDLQKIAAANVGDLFVILALLIRLYSGWGYVGSRLKSKVVEFEETGWYDGSVEYKTKEEKARDLFLYKSDVQPVEERLKAITLATAAFLVASCVALNITLSIKPIFDEYNPDMLEKLRADDKLAEVAARQSNGRPTYCDNRYYRAVANGGQGC